VTRALQRELHEEFGMRVRVGQALPAVDHAYTHFRVTLHPRVCLFEGLEPRVADRRRWCWVLPGELRERAMPRANRKVIEELERFLSR
jgi:A/G-specific adenine glycosylase